MTSGFPASLPDPHHYNLPHPRCPSAAAPHTPLPALWGLTFSFWGWRGNPWEAEHFWRRGFSSAPPSLLLMDVPVPGVRLNETVMHIRLLARCYSGLSPHNFSVYPSLKTSSLTFLPSRVFFKYSSQSWFVSFPSSCLFACFLHRLPLLSSSLPSVLYCLSCFCGSPHFPRLSVFSIPSAFSFLIPPASLLPTVSVTFFLSITFLFFHFLFLHHFLFYLDLVHCLFPYLLGFYSLPFLH